MTALLHSITMLVTSLGSAGVFLASVLEEIVVFIPSSLIQIGAGFFLVADIPLSFTGFGKVVLWVAIPAALGVTIGSLPIYYIAYLGGEPAVRKWGKWFLVRWSQVEHVRTRLAGRAITFWLFVLLKAMPAVPSAVVTAFCGAVKMPIGRYVVITLTGVFIRAFALGTVGWLAGDLYNKIVIGFDQIESVGTIIMAVLLVIGGGYLYIYAKRKRSGKA